MARTPGRLSVRQAALLLRCQELRATRLQRETDHAVATAAHARQHVLSSEQALLLHQAEAEVQLRQEYAKLLGQSLASSAFDSAGVLEARLAASQAQLRRELATRQQNAEDVVAQAQHAQQRSAAALRARARRERMFTLLVQDGRRLETKREGIRQDDENRPPQGYPR